MVNNCKNLLFVILIVAFLIPINSKAKIDGRLDSYEKNIQNDLKDTKPSPCDSCQIGLTSHHLPTAKTLISKLYNNISTNYSTVVIIGPDHFERCRGFVTIPKSDYQTSFGDLKLDQDIIKDLVKEKIIQEDQCFKGEHSIAVQANYLKASLGSKKIVPILLRAQTTTQDLDKIVSVLNKYKKNIIIIGSVDFSHYLSYEKAEIIDQKTERMLKDFSQKKFNLHQVDSPATLSLIIKLARKFNLNKVDTLERANSFKFDGRKINTTGYMSLIIKK